MNIRTDYDFPRFDPQSKLGHYESWFVRGNHPTRAQALWIRYTIFSPKGSPADAIGEIWAIYFDGEEGKHYVSKSEFPIQDCRFQSEPFHIQIGNSIHTSSRIYGTAGTKPGSVPMEWDLGFSGGSSPLFLFPENLYDSKFPKAKVLVGHPSITLNGFIKFGNHNVEVSDWKGSQNHNWGSKHTDQYAWGQVVGFDGDKDSFLELASAKLKLGPFWTPEITPIVFRFQGKEFALNGLFSSFKRAEYKYFDWRFQASSPEIRIEGRIHADKKDFACLRYANPPGGWKYCLNTKIARAELLIQRKGETSPLRLLAPRTAAFEILTEDSSHGLKTEV
ncbi:hypothetical protein EHQ53_12810 [Leptospira langatensis]|uniref:Tocopherol cyclase n=1 Tax=Leptospira langatensis TaxID=2484983 RepID=A0A5F1ZT88_9LEPT|nr:hypothetical protein [Leptospira langatensis]TGK02738.1 hypothetical protein EHO57_05300 [Leptospira langatensis]TGL40058.1 hypothetical protein EHQ53_12810 [Leptospira langatensis]